MQRKVLVRLDTSLPKATSICKPFSSVGLRSSSFSSLATTATIMTSIVTASASALGPTNVPAANAQGAMVAAFLSHRPLQRWPMDPACVAMFPPHAKALKTAARRALSMSQNLPDVLPDKSLKHKLGVDSTNYSVSRPIIVGHRGALYLELENTREGFQKCADMGCDAVELDVFLLKCGTLAVFHGTGGDDCPGDLLEYCGIKGSILDLTYEEVKNLKFNPNHAEFPCPINSIKAGLIPTLEEVLTDAKASGLYIKIELKGPNTVEPTLELVDRLNLANQCSFASFNLDRLALLRQLRPQKTEAGDYIYKTGALFNDLPSDFIEQAQNVGANEVHLRYDTCSLSAVTQIHDAGMGSMAWFRGPVGMTSDTLAKYWDVGNEDELMYATLLRTGVQSVCLNKPDVMIGLQRSREQLMLQEQGDEGGVSAAQPFTRAIKAES